MDRAGKVERERVVTRISMYTWEILPLQSLFLELPLSLLAESTTTTYTTMSSLSQRLLHTSLPHRILAARSGVRCITTNSTQSELALQARNLIRDTADENVAEPTRKFEANQVSPYPICPSTPMTNERSTPRTNSTNHRSIPKEAQIPVNPS